jgi:hypothetical protein
MEKILHGVWIGLRLHSGMGGAVNAFEWAYEQMSFRFHRHGISYSFVTQEG